MAKGIDTRKSEELRPLMHSTVDRQVKFWLVGPLKNIATWEEKKLETSC